MYLFIVIGHTGQGKTKWTREAVAGKSQYIFDINNEYDYPTDRHGGIYSQMRHIDMNVRTFENNVARMRNTCIVFEDATGFLRGRQSASFIRLVVAKRHTGNVFFLFFHSINRVPPEIMELANFVVLFKTVDNIDSLKKFKSDILTKTFIELQSAPDHSMRLIRLI